MRFSRVHFSLNLTSEGLAPKIQSSCRLHFRERQEPEAVLLSQSTTWRSKHVLVSLSSRPFFQVSRCSRKQFYSPPKIQLWRESFNFPAFIWIFTLKLLDNDTHKTRIPDKFKLAEWRIEKSRDWRNILAESQRILSELETIISLRKLAGVTPCTNQKFCQVQKS